MIRHNEINEVELHSKIRHNKIVFGGNFNLKIYGTLRCKSGKRMKKSNRVFFNSENEAIEMGYRPCGHCMNNAYRAWRKLHPKI